MKNAGMCSVTFRNKSAEEVIEIARRNALQCIEWGGDVHVPPDDRLRAAQVGALTRASGLKTLSYGSYYKCRAGEDFVSVSECAGALGAKIIRIWAGERSARELSAEDFSALVGRVRSCAGIARENGQTLAFEYHGGTFTDSPDSALRLLTEIDCTNVRCYFQPAYWLALPEKRAHEENLRAIELLNPFLQGVHVYEWMGYERFPLSDGQAKWREYIARSDGEFYNLEFVKDDSEAQFFQDAALLRRLCS